MRMYGCRLVYPLWTLSFRVIWRVTILFFLLFICSAGLYNVFILIRIVPKVASWGLTAGWIDKRGKCSCYMEAERIPNRGFYPIWDVYEFYSDNFFVRSRAEMARKLSNVQKGFQQSIFGFLAVVLVNFSAFGWASQRQFVI